MRSSCWRTSSGSSKRRGCGPFEAARAGDRGDRPGGAGHDALAGGDLPARVVHVFDFGPLSLSVRNHGGSRGAGEPARVVHADADDERAHAPARRPRPRGGQTGALAHAASIASSMVMVRVARFAWRSPCGRVVAVVRGAAVIASCRPAVRRGEREYVPDATSTRPSSRSAIEGPQGMSLAAMDEVMQAMDREIRRVRGVRLVLLTAAATSSPRSTRAAGTCALRRTTSASSRSTRLWRETLARRIRRGLPRQLHASAT